jgi:hypothetical protein
VGAVVAVVGAVVQPGMWRSAVSWAETRTAAFGPVADRSDWQQIDNEVCSSYIIVLQLLLKPSHEMVTDQSRIRPVYLPQWHDSCIYVLSVSSLVNVEVLVTPVLVLVWSD